MFVERKWPLILIEDSELSTKIKEAKGEEDLHIGDKMTLIGHYGKLIEIDDDSENLAASTHLCLTLSF